MEVVCGSYEGNVIGYSLPPAALVTGARADQLRASLPVFALSEHDGCVRAVACGGNLLATGGTDNTISVYNLRKRRAHGKLLQQVRGTFLLSAHV